MPPFNDLTGKRFGSLQAMWPVGRKGHYNRIMWACQCDDGNIVIAASIQLSHGDVRSCGCIRSHTIGNNRLCSRCLKMKPIDMFGSRIHKNGTRLRCYCRSCESIRTLGWKKKNKQANVANSRRTRLKTAYGIAEEDYDVIVKKQEGKCAICKEESSQRMDVDHNHVTNMVRGLLCRRCNIGLGQWGDNPELLKKAIDYLLSH